MAKRAPSALFGPLALLLTMCVILRGRVCLAPWATTRLSSSPGSESAMCPSVLRGPASVRVGYLSALQCGHSLLGH